MASDSKKKGLGAGLNDLFGITEGAFSTGRDTSPVMIKLSDIEPNREQPRRRFDEDALRELARSIESHGVITPVTLRSAGNGKYKLIAGERRWRASRMAGLTEIPALVIEADDRRATELALVENLQREDLNPVETSRGYETLMRIYGLTQEEVANAVGRSRPAVANALRLLSLPDEVLDMLVSGELTEGHARALLPLPDGNARTETAEKVASEGLSVRQTEALVKATLAKAGDKEPDPESEREREMVVRHTSELSTRLSEGWNRRVRVKPRANGSHGKIEIEYFDYDDLDEIASALGAIRAEKEPEKNN